MFENSGYYIFCGYVVHRGKQTKGEHLGLAEQPESRGHQYEGQQTKEQLGTASNKEMGRVKPGEAGQADTTIHTSTSSACSVSMHHHQLTFS